MIRRLALLGLLLAGRVAAAQSPIVRVDDAGPGVGPSVLLDALSHPFTVAPQGGGSYVIARGSDNPRSVVVLGRDAVVEGHVSGDVIVVGGDLYMHPGATIDGRALSFGGGVYESSLAAIAGGFRAFRDLTYDILPIAGGFSLRYRALTQPEKRGWLLGGVFGIASPEYDRSDGLVVGFAPRYAFPSLPIILSPKLSYHSQLGEFDPSLGVEYDFDRRMRIIGRVERATLSNDRWIRADLLNSADFLWNGNDVRNYYRATYGDVRLAKTWETTHGEVTPYIGGRIEDAKSVRPDIDALGGPWTFLERSDEDREDRLRFNPPINPGTTYSGLLGGTWSFANDGMVVHLRLDGEVGTFDPNDHATCGAVCFSSVHATFAQATIQGHFEFPTFAKQLLAMDGHFVATGGGTAPRQRYAYFGGPGTLPTLGLLSEGRR